MGLRTDARDALETKDYARAPLEERVAGDGVNAAELLLETKPEWWIPGAEVFPRCVFQQPMRGHFGEFARQGEDCLGRIGLWPRQWATAMMISHTAKGFHIHPPCIPEGIAPANWFQHLFGEHPADPAERTYDLEQWDVMFFICGRAEMFLVDERDGLPRKRMRFVIEGDDRPGPGNVGVVIPAGVAHAIRNIGSGDLIMVYGTSTTFVAENEGRISSEIERATLPQNWDTYFHGS